MSTISTYSAMQIVREISQLIHQHVNIMDAKGMIIASTNEQRIGTFHEGAKRISDEALEELFIENDTQYKGARRGMNLPISVEGELVGVVGITGKREEVEVYGRIIKKMTEILVIEEQHKEQEVLKNKIHTCYMEEWIFQQGTQNEETFVERGKLLNIDITLPRRVMVIGITKGMQWDDSRAQQKHLDQVEHTIKEILRKDHENNLYFKWNGKYIGVIYHQQDKTMCYLAYKIREQLAGGDHVSVAIGIDGGVHHFKHINKAYIEAKKAFRVAVNCKTCQLRVYNIINFEIFASEITEEMKIDFIKGLYKNIKKDEMMSWCAILEVFFETNGALGKASERLFMHKNTLQYKLKKIYEQTGYDPRQLRAVPIFLLANLFLKDVKDKFEDKE